MAEAFDDSELRSAINRGEIIGGALDARTGRIVPVAVVEVFRNEADGYTLYEYRNDKDAALAMLAAVDAGGQTRCWRLTEEARRAGYAETEVIYSGSGLLHHWDAHGRHTEYPAPEDVCGGQHQVNVAPGEAFMLVAGTSVADGSRLGARLLSFCTVPFNGSYEEVIDPSCLPTASH